VKLHLIRAGVALPEDTAENPDASDKALDRVVGLVSVPVGASVEEIKEKDKSPRKVINRLHAKRLWAPGPCAMVHSPEWNAWSRGRGRVAFRHLDPNDDWRPAWL
jgi:hypothetical protein